jgi:hypothetical protein
VRCLISERYSRLFSDIERQNEKEYKMKNLLAGLVGAAVIVALVPLAAEAQAGRGMGMQAAPKTAGVPGSQQGGWGRRGGDCPPDGPMLLQLQRRVPAGGQAGVRQAPAGRMGGGMGFGGGRGGIRARVHVPPAIVPPPSPRR